MTDKQLLDWLDSSDEWICTESTTGKIKLYETSNVKGKPIRMD